MPRRRGEQPACRASHDIPEHSMYSKRVRRAPHDIPEHSIYFSPRPKMRSSRKDHPLIPGLCHGKQSNLQSWWIFVGFINFVTSLTQTYSVSYLLFEVLLSYVCTEVLFKWEPSFGESQPRPADRNVARATVSSQNNKNKPEKHLLWVLGVSSSWLLVKPQSHQGEIIIILP